MSAAGKMFEYLLEKISEAEISNFPFAHIEITDFLDEQHFEAIVNDHQIALDEFSSTEELLDDLDEKGYKAVQFPGSVTDKHEYLNWFHGAGGKPEQPTTEGFGMVYRLAGYESPILKELHEFFASDRLKNLITDKFNIQWEVYVDAGIQKYLHGYEISPHADARGKAATWMLNLNPGTESEEMDFHTHYLQLKDQWRYISEFWRHNHDVQRCWIPWEWCDTVKRQFRNNSIVIFSPAHDTLHAVKADYDHLRNQRTQAFRNIWYDKAKLPYDLTKLKWIEYPGLDLKKSE